MTLTKTLTKTVRTLDNTSTNNVLLNFSAAKTSYVINMSGTGNDTVTGTAFDDTINGGNGKDLLKGTGGNARFN